MKNNLSRRDFLKFTGGGLLGGIIALNVPSIMKSSRAKEVTDPAMANITGAPVKNRNLEKHYFGFVADTEKCIGCGKCVVACKEENRVSWEPEYNRTWIERYVIAEDKQVFVDSPNAGRDGFAAAPMNEKYKNLDIWKSFFVPKLCNQCENPPCVSVCPVGATYVTNEGIVLVDQKHCIGCRYCIQACPYGARYVLPPSASAQFGQSKVIDKCTWCYHRITKGVIPACVEVCPVGARIFGDMRDPESPVSKVLKEKRFYVLKPSLGTEPKVYYLGFEKGVQ